MTPGSPRWKEITRSEFPWEREALAFVRGRLPDHEPYRAWSTFEFIAEDGSVNEVDLLVLAPQGLFLVEIKSRPGQVTGDAGAWTWHHGGRRISLDNPLLLANKKAKRLVGLLRRQRALTKVRPPFVEALVFLSDPQMNCQLGPGARHGVYLRDREADGENGSRSGIVERLTARPAGEGAGGRRPPVDAPVARAVSRAMEEAGIRRSQRQSQVGDYVLANLLFEGPGYQDWEARHVTLTRVTRRVRIYPIAPDAGTAARETLTRAAQREFQVLADVQHPGILRAVDYREDARGPALVFDHDPRSVRLDHFLLERGSRLDANHRLAILRQLSDALRHAHGKKLVHRALSPQSVLVIDPDAPAPTVQIFNWQTAARQFGSTSSHGATLTRHLDALVEVPATGYMAPEALTDQDASGEQLDVFGLGAIAYHLFGGQPPATSSLELADKLREGQGLQVAAVLNGAGKELSWLIQFATHPQVSSRLDSVDDFLEQLERVEDELTRPDDEQRVTDPTEARPGQRLEGGFVVRKRLGKGSTAVVFLVEKDGRAQVLKLALDPGQNARLLDEAEVLRQLRHQFIVELHGTVTIGDRVGLLMAKAGEETLAQRLRAEGRLHVDLLQRFGENLLQAVDLLEQQGIPHRDIKPDNIGVAPTKPGDRLQLVLFDFSLSRVPAERIHAGTTAYLDPFLSARRPPRWDLAAERFSAAMTLHEMATGTLPRWGDGRSNPAVLDCEVTLDTELFEPSLRERLSAFFQRALRRDFRARFDNAEDMLRTWRHVFEHLDRPPIPTDHEGLGQEAALEAAIAGAAFDSPLAALGLSTRALNALERVNAIDVRSLLRLPVAQISHMRGVGNKTRRELLDVLRKLNGRFPGVEPEPAAPQPDTAPAVSSVDLVARQLIPEDAAQSATEAREPRVLRRLLGLDDLPSPAPMGWPSQSDVAESEGITRARVGQILGKARERWGRNPSLTAVRDDVVAMLQREGGVMTALELREAVLLLRGSAREGVQRGRLGTAVVRAASEAERALATARWIVRRSGDVVLIAETEELADWAERLGQAADRLAAADPLPSPGRVVEDLQSVALPAGRAPVAPARLVRLAAAASCNAALSSRLELYPRGMSAERTIKLAHGALLVPELTEPQLRTRVALRYPDAASLPGRPQLDELLATTGLPFAWAAEANQGRGAYRLRASEPGVSSISTSLDRRGTVEHPSVDASPEVAACRLLEERLRRASQEGGFLVLTVDIPRLRRAERELAQRRFSLEPRSLEAELIRHMRAEAERSGADWNVVLRADAAARDTLDWQNLLILVDRALGAVDREMPDKATVLLTNPGLLARYDRIGFLERLRDRVGRRLARDLPALHGVWVLVASGDGSALPAIDGKSVPVVGPGEWAHVSDAWLENRHRGAPGPGIPDPARKARA